MKTIEISIKELAVSILYRWVPILLVIVVFAALFGVQGYFDQKNLLGEYEKNLFDAQQSIVSLNARKIAASDYVENALPISDASNVEVTYIRFRIYGDPATSDIYKVALEYVTRFRNISLRSILKEVLPQRLDEKLLRKLVVLNEDQNGFYDSNDPGFMTIRVFGAHNLDSSVLADTVYNYFINEKPAITLVAGQFDISFIEKNEVNATDSSMDQKKVSELINQLNANLIMEAVTKADPKISSDKNAIEDKETEIEIASVDDLIAWYDSEVIEIEDEIVALQQQKPDIAGGAVGAAGMGAAIGVALGILIASIGYVAKLPVLVPEQPQRQLGLRYLGGIRRNKGVFLAGLGDKLAGDFLLSPEVKETIAIIVANTNELISENSKILITGTVSSTIVHEFAQRLKDTDELKTTELVVADNVNKSADAIRKLSEADSVILVERLRISTLRQIGREQERINFSGKRILGYVLY